MHFQHARVTSFRLSSIVRMQSDVGPNVRKGERLGFCVYTFTIGLCDAQLTGTAVSF